MGLFTVESEIIINNLTPRHVARPPRAPKWVGVLSTVFLEVCMMQTRARTFTVARRLHLHIQIHGIDVALTNKVYKRASLRSDRIIDQLDAEKRLEQFHTGMYTGCLDSATLYY